MCSFSWWPHAVVEQRRLGEMVTEGFATLTHLVGIDALVVGLKTTIGRTSRGFFRPTPINGVWFVGRTTLINHGAMLSVALAVMERHDRPVDWNFMKVRPAQSADLGIGVGKQTALQQWVVSEIDAPARCGPGRTQPARLQRRSCRGLRLSTILPSGVIGTSSSGMILVGSSKSKSNVCSSSSATICTPSSHSG